MQVAFKKFGANLLSVNDRTVAGSKTVLELVYSTLNLRDTAKYVVELKNYSCPHPSISSFKCAYISIS
jgi:hypothetical protein